jgi:formyltetrahydrofolate-dependent phosphoribosylglycinamide formyltransferase
METSGARSLPLRLAVLLSGSGSTLQNFLDRIADGSLPARIVVVVASRPDAYGLERARRAGVPALCVTRTDHADVEAFNSALHEALEPHAPDLVLLAGFLFLFQPRARYAGRVLNVHPALIPAFCGKGYYGARVHRAVLESGVKVSGCTVHIADDQYDHGPIILQGCVPVHEDDTPETLAERVQSIERELYPEAVRLWAAGRLRVEGRRVRILPEDGAR